MTELVPAPCEKCGHVEYTTHHYIIDALIRKIAKDRGEPLPKAGNFYGDRADAIMFEALVEMIASDTGRGFHNVDQGHPAYLTGARGDIGMGDGPDENSLFQVLQRFDRKYHEEICDLSTWQKFCRFAADHFSMGS